MTDQGGEPALARTRTVRITPAVSVGGDAPTLFIAGPCVIESEEHCLHMARQVADAAQAAGVPVVFKASFDKANRSSVSSFRGPGLDEGLRILAKVKQETGLPLLSDIHAPEQAAPAAETLDILQIPAFLCRQTDLLVAAGRTGRTVSIKKGQFVSPWDMRHAADKVRSGGDSEVLLTERGFSFGYRNLVVDMRSLPVLRETGCPVVFDATHSVQQPGGLGDRSGGEPRFIEVLARAAAAAGIDALFTETHDDPDNALSDGSNALPLPRLAPLMKRVAALSALVRRDDA